MNKINNLLDRLDGEYNKKQLNEHSKLLTPLMGSTNEATFVGRQKDVAVIDKFFSISNALVLVSSIEGVGKSSLASHYLHKNKDNFDYYGYVKINDSFRQSFTASFKDSLDLKLEHLDDLFIEAVTKLSRLEGRKLLIIDNSKGVVLQEEKLNLILSLINNNFKILFISDTKIKDVREYHVAPLNQEDAIHLFINYSPTSKLDQVRTIVEYCGNHTFFIKLIAKMIRSRRTTFDEIITKFKNKELLPLVSGDTKANIHTNIEQLLEIEQLDFEHKLLLKRFSILPSIEIDIEFLEKLFRENVQNQLDFLANIGLLSRLGNGYKMHHIIKYYIHDYIPPTLQEIALMVDFFAKIINDSHNPNSVKEAKKYLIYLKSIKTILLSLPEKNATIYTFFENLGNIYYHLGEYHKALDLLQKSLEMQKHSIGIKPLILAQNYNDLGLVYKSIKDFERALMFFKKGLQIRQQELGDEHLEISYSYNNIGLLYRLSGNYEESLLFFEKALRIKEHHLDKFDPDLASLYNNIALTYQKTHNHKGAAYFFAKALRVREKALGEEHPHTAQIYSDLAMLYKDMKKYPKALAQLERSVAIYNKHFGANHKKNIANYNKLALIYVDIGKDELALEYLNRVLNIKLATLGPHHPRTAIAYNNLGIFHLTQTDYTKALSLFRKALFILNTISRYDDLDLMMVHYNLATTHYHLGEYRDSIEIFKKVLKIRLEVLGEHHPDTILSYNALAATYYELVMDEEALKIYEKTLELSKDISGDYNLNTALSYNNIAVLYFNKTQYIKASRYMQQCVEIRQKFLNKDEPYLIESKNRLKLIQTTIEKIQKNPKHENFIKFRLDFFTHSHNLDEMLVMKY
ncbi:MAG: tetratricopeptide repeat protein [Campylobacterales bacterium]|nr:tetratricopeptide repeat protein [Campylobacterales bacterium]